MPERSISSDRPRGNSISRILTPVLLVALVAAVAGVFSSCTIQAQPRATPEPTTPPARSYHDPRSGVTIQVPAGWNLSLKDGETSTFRLDARSAPHSTQMRALVSIAFNPYPESTFSGAFFYLSLNPHLSAPDCARQATVRAPQTASTTQIASVPFSHGYDEHGGICTEARDEIYTALHRGTCYRFDLIVNSFCGGDVSGVRDMTPAQLEAVRHRLEAILATVQFDK
ncbi:hypothetical protein [Granulicella sp. dw_53]|uniref:hypothetical protein n=1 Tax=Granulicella sp. dw_53 TaxID=2719792 RepID=UPI001BD4B41C|nr:hypothetical protein [Granulicella sp. dw_53]